MRLEMRKFFFNSILFVFLVFSANYAFAQQQAAEEVVTIKKSQLTPEQLNQLATENLKAKVEMYGKWVGLGKEIGSAVDGSLSALTQRADEFAKTGVGKFTLVLVAYKVVGKDIIQVLIGIPMLVVGFTIWVWAFRKNCITRSVLAKELPDKTKVYETINYGRDMEGERWGHVAVLALYLVLCLFVIFL